VLLLLLLLPKEGAGRRVQSVRQDAATVGVTLSSHGSQLHKRTNVRTCSIICM
jgi:polyribonucleotide nucleotidyltransferase